MKHQTRRADDGATVPFPAPELRELHPETNANVSILTEALSGFDAALLYVSPVYYGLGVPRGDGSAVVLIPMFLGPDLYLIELFRWLRRVGYSPYYSGIGLNAECPNLLIQRRLGETIDRALAETGRPVHLIGHSLGGVIARSLAGQRPGDVRSVITLGSPFRGPVAHRSILALARLVRGTILATQGSAVLPACYMSRCTCDFAMSVRRDVPAHIRETAIFSRADGIVDSAYCMTSCADKDIEVRGTHLGLVFNADVYRHIGQRLAECGSRR